MDSSALDGKERGRMIWNFESNKSPFSSSLKFIFQHLSDRHDLVLLGKYAQLTKIHFRPKRTIKYKNRQKNTTIPNKRADT